MDKFKFQAKLIMENKLNFIHPWDMERCDEIYDIPKNWNISPNGCLLYTSPSPRD